MELLASFNGSGNFFLGLLLLPFFLAGPFVLLFLEARAFLKSEAQSFLLLLLLLALGVCACLYGYQSGKEFSRTMGFTRTHLILCWIGGVIFPLATAWEGYKRGWFSSQTVTFLPVKKKRQPKKKSRSLLRQ